MAVITPYPDSDVTAAADALAAVSKILTPLAHDDRVRVLAAVAVLLRADADMRRWLDPER